MKNKYFTEWIEANIMIPKLIIGNVNPKVEFNYHHKGELKPSILDNLTYNIHVIPDEYIESFIIRLTVITNTIFDIIGFDINKYQNEPKSFEIYEKMNDEIYDLTYKYEDKVNKSITDLILELFDIPKKSSDDIVTTLIKF